MNSLTSDDRQRMTYQGSLLGLKNRSIGSGARERSGRSSTQNQSLASRTQRLGSVSDIRQQLMNYRNNRNQQPRGRDKRAHSVGDIKPNYIKGGLDEARAKALNERLRQLGGADIRSMTRNAIEGKGSERKRKGIDLETIRQIKSD